MKDQNSKKCQQIELSFMFKTDKKKPQNYFISLSHDKMPNTSREN